MTHPSGQPSPITPAVRLFSTGTAGLPVQAEESTPWLLLLLPGLGLLAGLAGAGIMITVRELALRTMPYESIENLRTAELRGCYAGAAAAIVAVAALTRGWRLRACSRSLGKPRRWALVLLVGLQITLLGWAVLRGHGTLAVVTSQFGSQVVGLWALGWGVRIRDPARPAAVAGRRAALLAITLLAGVVPLVALVLDDDPRRRMLPYALAAIPIAVIVGCLVSRMPRWRRLGGWALAGSLEELAVLTIIAVIGLGT